MWKGLGEIFVPRVYRFDTFEMISCASGLNHHRRRRRTGYILYLYVSSLLWNSRLVAFYLHNIWKRTGQQQTRGSPPTVLTVHHKSTWLHCKWSQSFYCYFELLLRDRELIIMFFLMLYCIDSCRTLVLIICTPRFIFNFLCDDDPLHSFDYQIYIYIYVRGKNSIIIYIVPN